MEGIIRTGIVFFCHDGKGNYLIHKRSKNCRDEQGRWDCGGGGVKFGERIEEALRREVFEEYKATPLNVEFIGYRDVFRGQEASVPHWIAFDFKVEVDPTVVVMGEPHKMDELRWMTIEQILALTEPVHSQLFSTIEANRKYLV